MNQEIRDKQYIFDTKKSKIWFTSDTHFGHKNILKFCNRPFENVEQMNEQLIELWNSTVSKKDIVFHLGDLVFGGTEMFEKLVPQLNGKIYFVYGNHDYKNIKDKYKKYFVDVQQKMVIQVDNQPIILNHEPLLCFGGQQNNKYWNLFGHVHTQHGETQGTDFSRMLALSTPTMYDVGCDFNDYKPISFEKVKQKIEYQVQNNKNYIEAWK